MLVRGHEKLLFVMVTALAIDEQAQQQSYQV